MKLFPQFGLVVPPAHVQPDGRGSGRVLRQALLSLQDVAVDHVAVPEWGRCEVGFLSRACMCLTGSHFLWLEQSQHLLLVALQVSQRHLPVDQVHPVLYRIITPWGGGITDG